MTQINLESEYKKIAGDQEILGDPLGDPAYLYCRSSDRVQAEEGRESLSRQLLFADERGKRDGYYVPLDMVYWDVWTGKDVDRPEFMRLLKDVEKDKRSSFVYIDSTDRLSRSKAVYYVLSYDLTRYGLDPVFKSDEDDLIRHIKLAFDELELARRSERQIQANRARARKGKVTSRRAAYGFKFNDDKTQYLIDEEQAFWIRQISHWIRVEGLSIRACTFRLMEKGVPSPTGGENWHQTSLKRIMQSETLKGVFIANRHVIEKKWVGGEQKIFHVDRPEEEWIYVDIPAIIPGDEWDELQEAMARNSQTQPRNSLKNSWLLAGLVKCGACGYTMTCSTMHSSKVLKTTGEKKTYKSLRYQCSHRVRTYTAGKCDRATLAKDTFENMFLEALDLLFVSPDMWYEAIEEFAENTDRWERHYQFHTNQIEELEEQLAELLRMAVKQRTDTARRVFQQQQYEIEEAVKDHRKQQHIAEKKMRAAKRKTSHREQVERMIQEVSKIGGMKSLPFKAQRQIVTTLIDEVLLDPKEQWFEIVGIIDGRFRYNEDGLIVDRDDYSPLEYRSGFGWR